jgi:predicted ATPase
MGGKPLVGRAGELSRLDRALDEIAGSAGDIVLLDGEPGIGKSRLVEATLDEAESRGLRVLHGVCGELERDVPYAPVASARH